MTPPRTPPSTPQRTPEDRTGTDELQRFYGQLQSADLHPLWNLTAQLLTPTPRPRAVPWLWSRATMHPLARRAIDLVPVERGGERRVLSLGNPGLDGLPFAAGTLWGAIQCLGPRESAPAHRHSAGAIRFVLEGEGVWTTVDGDACDMHPGDLVLTPGGQWHDHTNGGDCEMFWFDGLDLPLVTALDAVFFEEYPELRQPAVARGEHNRSAADFPYRSEKLAPGGTVAVLDPTPSPLLVYRWADTEAELERLQTRRPGSAVTMEFVNPRSGASVLPTLSCAVQRVPAGVATAGVRRTGNTVAVVFAGSGHSVIDGQRFDWSSGDMFVVPSWSAVEHHAAERADLFLLSDTPVLRALGLHREQALEEPQPVTTTFRPR